MTYDVGALGVALASIALACALLRAIGPSSLLSRGFRSYREHLGRELAFLLSPVPPGHVAVVHAGLLVTLVVAALGCSSLVLGLLVPVLALLPAMVLSQRRVRRLRAVEPQVAVWATLVANGLKAAPSIAEAVRASVAMTPKPLAEEIDLVVKECALGVPLDQALQTAADRVGSPSFASVITTLVIGRRTGGDLTEILEEVARTLREMERLEGVVRTKTAEGKTQAYVLAAIPFVLASVLQLMDDSWLPSFTRSALGWGLVLGAVMLWVGAIALARRILAVDV